MSNHIRVGLIGDYNPKVTAHQAIPKALTIAGDQLNCTTEGVWLGTVKLVGDIDEMLSQFEGLWCVPASPYANMDGALAAIRYTRENGVPFLGTCGGYQHAVLEYARNVLGFSEAGNIEVDPHTKMPLISPLTCALVEKNGVIEFKPHSHISKIYGVVSAEEAYRCSFGFNPQYIPLFDETELVISGKDSEGEPRVIELTNHPFFIGTAYQPERSALQGNGHPLITAFVASILDIVGK